MLDISYLSDDNNEHPSFIIKDSEFKLFDPAFTELKNQTGVYIDPYGKCRIYPSHQKILISLLSKNNESRVIDFISFLKKAIQLDEVLFADGD
ncbi:hypothetical protein [Pseudomonas rhizophila]|uniref:hypothetical protein n=1 Tax=Pseudomonas TaxID=286 RepID=UPI0030DDBBB3